MKCNRCKGERIVKAGISKCYIKNGTEIKRKQNYFCKDCRRFTVKPLID